MPGEFSRCVQLLVAGASVGLVSLLIWACFVGWGRFVAFLLPRNFSAGPGLAGAIGMAFTTVAGGALNLFGVISVSLLRGYLIAGIVLSLLFVFLCRTKLRSDFSAALAVYKRDSYLALLTLIAVGMLMLQLFAAGSQPFDELDDYQGYLIFPIKMLQTGSLGSDPFNTRCMFSLGGESLLLALTSALLPPKALHALGMGAAWLVLVGVFLEHARKIGVPARYMAGITILLHLITVPALNLSSMVTGMALIYAIVVTFAMNNEQISEHGRLVLLGLFCAGVCALKSSHIPGCLMVMAACGLVRNERGSLARVGLVVAAGTIAGFLLVPWMITSYQTYGTPLFPLLGKGYAQSVQADYTEYLTSWLIVQMIVPVLALTVGSPFFVAGLGMAGRKFLLSSLPGRIGIASFCSAWIAAAVTLALTPGVSRYSFPYTTVATLFLLAQCGARSVKDQAASHVPWDKRYVGIAALIFVLGATWTSGLVQMNQRLKKVVAGKPQWSDDGQDLRKMQRAIPEGSPILVHLSRPFLLDFSRNIVYVVDLPGTVSPPPGLQVLGTAEEIAQYLVSKSIRYIAYSYKDEAGMPLRKQAGPYSKFPRTQSVFELTFAFHERLDELDRMYERVFDDGNTYVIDLWKKRAEIGL
jgi:hypothetical protein